MAEGTNSWHTFDDKQGGCDGIGDSIAGDALVDASVVLGEMQYRQVVARVFMEHSTTGGKHALVTLQKTRIWDFVTAVAYWRQIQWVGSNPRWRVKLFCKFQLHV